MSDAPERIGLVGDGFVRWSLWSRQDNAMDSAIQYIRADIAAARIEELERERDNLREKLDVTEEVLGHAEQRERAAEARIKELEGAERLRPGEDR